MKLHPRRIVFCFIVLFLVFALLEILLIVLDPFLFKGFYQYDADLGFRVRPSAKNSNSFGFNDRDYSLQKERNTFRILIVGDSFNWIGGRKDNYTARIEKKFEEYYGRHCVDIINVGYPMTHPAEHLAMLKKYGLQYNPDFVFLGFFAGNDFLDANPHRKRIIICNTFVDIDKRKERTVFGYPVLSKPRVAYILRQYYKILKEQLKVRFESSAKTAGANGRGQGFFTEKTFLAIEEGRLQFCHTNKHADSLWADRIECVFQAISEMDGLLKRGKVGFMVGLYPDEFQVNEDLLEAIFKTYNLKREEYAVDLTQKILTGFLEAEGISYVDLFEGFKSRQEITPLYSLRDTHWNEAGNNLAADIIFRRLLAVVKKSDSCK